MPRLSPTEAAGLAAANRGVRGGRRPPSRPEREVVREILKYLGTRTDVTAWRQNSGMLRGSYKGKERVIRFGGMAGMADIIGWQRERVAYTGLGVRWIIARFIAIECKGSPSAKPSPHQEAFLNHVHASGGIAILASSVADVVEALGT